MPPELISLAIFAIQQIIKNEPAIAAEIHNLMTKGDPTQADWDALHAKIALKSYRDYVPDTALPAAAPSPAVNAGTIPVLTVLPPPVPPQVDKAAVSAAVDAGAHPPVATPAASQQSGGSQPAESQPMVNEHDTVREQSILPPPGAAGVPAGQNDVASAPAPASPAGPKPDWAAIIQQVVQQVVEKLKA